MTQKTVESMISGMADGYALQSREMFLEIWENRNFDVTEWSPIELLMATGLFAAMLSNKHLAGEGGDNEIACKQNVLSFDKMDFRWTVPYGVWVYPQMRIGRYCADFVLNVRHYRGGAVVGVIECDGHDFHEKTKEQAQHDKVRDRYFQSLGLIVLRYTGAELFRDPIACAHGAIQILRERANQLTKR